MVIIKSVFVVFQAKMPFDDNKLYCSEVLSILLQNHEGTLDRFCCSCIYFLHYTFLCFIGFICIQKCISVFSSFSHQPTTALLCGYKCVTVSTHILSTKDVLMVLNVVLCRKSPITW